MKLLTKLTLVAATLTALGTSAAFADDQQLPARLASQHAQNSPRTTVAVYADHRGVSRIEAPANDAQSYQVHLNAHSVPIGS